MLLGVKAELPVLAHPLITMLTKVRHVFHALPDQNTADATIGAMPGLLLLLFAFACGKATEGMLAVRTLIVCLLARMALEDGGTTSHLDASQILDRLPLIGGDRRSYFVRECGNDKREQGTIANVEYRFRFRRQYALIIT